jgi:hypothetical protein
MDAHERVTPHLARGRGAARWYWGPCLARWRAEWLRRPVLLPQADRRRADSRASRAREAGPPTGISGSQPCTSSVPANKKTFARTTLDAPAGLDTPNNFSWRSRQPIRGSPRTSRPSLAARHVHKARPDARSWRAWGRPAGADRPSGAPAPSPPRQQRRAAPARRQLRHQQLRQRLTAPWCRDADTHRPAAAPGELVAAAGGARGAAVAAAPTGEGVRGEAGLPLRQARASTYWDSFKPSRGHV